jgi:phenylpropionate dioxygenase-like ring-hydroxylating dioxygenase large terminal subunit
MQSPSLTSQYLDIRQLGINPNHWYVVARSTEVQTQPLGVTFGITRLFFIEMIRVQSTP